MPAQRLTPSHARGARVPLGQVPAPGLRAQAHAGAACAQGEFAFFIWDDDRKQVFAARDPSGFEPLYYHVDEDDGIRCELCYGPSKT